MKLLKPFVLGRVAFVAGLSLLIGAVSALCHAPLILTAGLVGANILFWTWMSSVTWSAQSRSFAATLTGLLVVILPAFLLCLASIIYSVMGRHPLPWISITGAVFAGYFIFRAILRLNAPGPTDA